MRRTRTIVKRGRRGRIRSSSIRADAARASRGGGHASLRILLREVQARSKPYDDDQRARPGRGGVPGLRQPRPAPARRQRLHPDLAKELAPGRRKGGRSPPPSYDPQDMIVLGINETHCATAAVLRDGAIVGCASEERFSRLKNDAGYPRRAVDALLADLRIERSAIDLVVLAGARAYAREWMNRVVHDDAYAREYYGISLEAPAGSLRKRARKLGARLGLADAARGKFALSPAERLRLMTDHLGVDADRIVALDHHTCHAAAAYFGSPFGGADALVLTNDNSGDGLCATATTASGLTLTRREAAPSSPGSLGS